NRGGRGLGLLRQGRRHAAPYRAHVEYPRQPRSRGSGPDGLVLRAFLTTLLIALVPASAIAQSSTPAPSDPGSRIPNPGGIDKTGVVVDSLALLGIEHGIRLAFQPGTRRELRGNFWRDYRRSVRVPTSWEDTDSWLVNYVGHPIHGAAAGYLWVEHDPQAPHPTEIAKPYLA